MSVIFVTGQPGVGKSLLVLEIIRQLGIKVGGIITPEIRKNGRMGFKIVDLMDGRSGTLASVDTKGPKVGRYGVNINDIEHIGVRAIERALSNPAINLIVIDELGRMEMISENFKRVIEKAIDSGKDCLIVLHRSYVARYGKRGQLFILTKQNRKKVKEQIIELLNINRID